MIIEEPFPHIVLTDALPHKDYKDLFLAWEIGQPIDVKNPWKENRIPRQEFAWKEGLAERLMGLFDIDGISTLGRFMLRKAGFQLNPHIDPVGFQLTVLHYMPTGNTDKRLGTALYKAPPVKVSPRELGARYSKEYTLVKRIPYAHNTVLAFLNLDHAVHGLPRIRNDRLAYQWHIK